MRKSGAQVNWEISLETADLIRLETHKAKMDLSEYKGKYGRILE